MLVELQVEGAPKVVKEGLKKEEAEALQKTLVEGEEWVRSTADFDWLMGSAGVARRAAFLARICVGGGQQCLSCS